MNDAPPDHPRSPPPEHRGLGYWIGFAIGFTARWTLRLVLLFGLLVLLTYLLIQVPAVQRYAAQQAAGALSASLGVEVRVGSVAIEPFTSVRLGDVLLGDRQGDTLLVAPRLSARFFQPLRSLLDRTLYVEALAIEGARIKLYRDERAPDGNEAFLLPKFSRRPAENFATRDPFQLNLARLDLRDVAVDYRDAFSGIEGRGRLDELALRVNALDLPAELIDAERLAVAGLDLDATRRLPTATRAPQVSSGLPEPDDGLPALPAPMFGNVYVRLDEFALDSLRLRYRDLRPTLSPSVGPGGFDARDIDVRGVRLRLDDLVLEPDSLGAKLTALSAEEQSGLRLVDLSAGTVALTPRLLKLDGLNLQTSSSRLGDRVEVRLPAGATWADALRRGRVELDLLPSSVQLGELARFVPQLKRLPFYAGRAREKVQLRGELRGTLANLSARDLSIRLPDGTYLVAEGSVRDVLTPGETVVNARVEEAATSIARLRKLLPGVGLPTDLDRLGELQFSGRFDGFLDDFVAYGDLRTELGRATLDTRVLATPGAPPRYTGEAAVYDFDLGTYTGNAELGRVTARADIREGSGLRPRDLRLDLIGRIAEIGFRGYTYRDIELNGQLAPDRYEGAVRLADEHADLDFLGTFVLGDADERFEFEATIRRLDLAPLKLSASPWSVSGALTLEANTLDLDNLRGAGSVRDFTVRHADGRSYQLAQLTAEQAIAPDGSKRLSLTSPLATVDLSGEYRLLKLPGRLRRAFAKTYPELYARAGLPAQDASASADSTEARISLEATALQLDSLLQTFGLPLRQLDGSSLALTLDTETSNLDLSFASAAPRIGGVTLDGLAFDLRGQSGELDLDARASSLDLGAYHFDALQVYTEYADGDIRFSVSADTATNVLGDVNFAGAVLLADTTVSISLDPSSHLDIGGERWTVEAGNELVIGNKQLTARDVKLRAGERYIELESLGQRGLNVLLRRFDLDLLNAYLNPDKIQVAGEVDAFFSAEDIYAREGITFTASVDTFQMNGVDWGALQTLVRQPEASDPLSVYTTFSRLGQQAILDGQVALQDGTVIGGQARPAQYFDARFTSEDFDMSFISYFVPGVNDLVGKLSADLRVRGTPDAPVPSGGLLVDDCALTIDYTKTRYFVDSQYVSIDERILDATGRQIRDKFGNTATLVGGLLHDDLKVWTLDLAIRANELFVLDTEKADNPLFYGQAFASGRIAFTGPFNQTQLSINAAALSGSRVVFPVSGSSSEDGLRFINFRQEADSVRQGVATFLRGINLDMTIEVTPAAELLIVFDEAAGDILRGQGTGTLKIDVQRSGSYSMFGELAITQGDYLFTLLNVVNKPFAIRPGGTIVWDGDPFTAQLDLVAEYKGLSVAPFGLIAEYQQALEARGTGLLDLAKQPTRVSLLMQLDGDLLRPDLGFNIELPDLQGDLRNYVNSKLALIRQDENLLNRQVFGLIVIGQFLPELNDLQASSVGVNTISELFSNQLSYLLTELFTSLAGTEGALSGIDIDINLQNNTSLSTIDGGRGNDLQTQLRTYFFDDRLEVGLGAAFNNNQTVAGTGVLTAGNFEVSYALTEDRRLRLKTFASTNVDINNSSRNRAGVGLSWRRQFDSFAELFGYTARARRRTERNDGIFRDAAPSGGK